MSIRFLWYKAIHCQAHWRSPLMNAFLQNIDACISKPLRVLKHDKTSTVVLVQIGSQQVVVKRFNTKNKRHFCRRLFQQSRAKINWHFAQILSAHHFLTFEPIAMVEEKLGPFKGRSYFICTYIEGTEALHYFDHRVTTRLEWQAVVSNIAIMIKKLAQVGLHHRDLNLSNIILIGNQPLLIDLDSMRQHISSQKKKWILHKTYARFMENWEEIPNISQEVIRLFQSFFKLPH